MSRSVSRSDSALRKHWQEAVADDFGGLDLVQVFEGLEGKIEGSVEVRSAIIRHSLQLFILAK